MNNLEKEIVENIKLVNRKCNKYIKSFGHQLEFYTEQSHRHGFHRGWEAREFQINKLNKEIKSLRKQLKNNQIYFEEVVRKSLFDPSMDEFHKQFDIDSILFPQKIHFKIKNNGKV